MGWDKLHERYDVMQSLIEYSEFQLVMTDVTELQDIVLT